MTRIAVQPSRASAMPAPGGAGDIRLAAIDVGSNSLHMVIAQIDADGGATNLWRMKEMVGLGRNSFPLHFLSQEAMDRALLTLKRFQSMATRRGCEKIVAVATSAVREAENGGDFIERARREVGLNVRVVSAREEARLIHLGVRHGMDFGGRSHLILDIGGGSAEFIVTDGTQPLMLESRKLGSARMTARFIKSDPAKSRQVEALLAHCDAELADVWEQVKKIGIQGAVGTSGTMENLAMMCRQGKRPEDGQLIEIERGDLDELVEGLLASDAGKRVAIKGLDEKRQDQILAGALLVQLVMRRLELKSFTLCRTALREGILLDYVGRHLPDLAVRRQVPDPRRRSVLDLARRCEWNESHSNQVARITMRLFDELRPLHELDDRSRELIEYGAMLHDIGWHISSADHHKHSMYLVLHGNLKGFTTDEIRTIANLTRYHRKAMPKPTHGTYTELPRECRRIVDVGASLLRMADGLDRSHCRVVGDLHCKIRKRRVKVRLSGRNDMELELWAARRKTDLFIRVFGRTVTFEAP